MGRKKRTRASIVKPFWYYCDREFDDEFTLVQHQKARHFAWHVCKRQFQFASSMAIHVLQVHKEQIYKVPNAKAGRDEINIDINGMDGVPSSLIDSRISQPPTKKARIEPIQTISTKPEVRLVYSDDYVSVEEKRAALAKYRYDASSIAQEIEKLDTKIDDRMEALLGNLNE